MSPPYYRDAASGVWGYPTSTMDWCEENYYVTYTIAEFWNTLSNVVFIVPPVLTVLRTRRLRIFEHRYILCFLLLALVGTGSVAFHCTLLYQSQLLDELPMVYGTCAMIYCILEVEGAEGAHNLRTAFILIFVSITVSLGYILVKTPTFFLWSYGLLAALLFLLNMRGCIKHKGSRTLLAWSVISYMFGFLLWNIDNEMCYDVRDLRERTPTFLRPMTQLHAWWHFFAGIGTFLCIAFSLHLRLCALGYKPSLRLIYKFIPYYVAGDRRKEKEPGGPIIGVDLLDHNHNHVVNMFGVRHNDSITNII